jgi:hypothetical protein
VSTLIDDGGPAFPFDWVDFQPTTGDQVVREQFSGMSLRDHFASRETLSEWDNHDAVVANQMAEALAGYPRPSHGWKCETASEWLAMVKWEADWRAALRYIRADAMIKARKLLTQTPPNLP